MGTKEEFIKRCQAEARLDGGPGLTDLTKELLGKIYDGEITYEHARQELNKKYKVTDWYLFSTIAICNDRFILNEDSLKKYLQGASKNYDKSRCIYE